MISTILTIFFPASPLPETNKILMYRHIFAVLIRQKMNFLSNRKGVLHAKDVWQLTKFVCKECLVCDEFCNGNSGAESEFYTSNKGSAVWMGLQRRWRSWVLPF